MTSKQISALTPIDISLCPLSTSLIVDDGTVGTRRIELGSLALSSELDALLSSVKSLNEDLSANYTPLSNYTALSNQVKTIGENVDDLRSSVPINVQFASDSTGSLSVTINGTTYRVLLANASGNVTQINV